MSLRETLKTNEKKNKTKVERQRAIDTKSGRGYGKTQGNDGYTTMTQEQRGKTKEKKEKKKIVYGKKRKKPDLVNSSKIKQKSLIYVSYSIRKKTNHDLGIVNKIKTKKLQSKQYEYKSFLKLIKIKTPTKSVESRSIFQRQMTNRVLVD